MNLKADEVLRAFISVFTIFAVLSLDKVGFLFSDVLLCLFLSLKSSAQRPNISPMPPNR